MATCPQKRIQFPSQDFGIMREQKRGSRLQKENTRPKKVETVPWAEYRKSTSLTRIRRTDSPEAARRRPCSCLLNPAACGLSIGALNLFKDSMEYNTVFPVRKRGRCDDKGTFPIGQLTFAPRLTSVVTSRKSCNAAASLKRQSIPLFSPGCPSDNGTVVLSKGGMTRCKSWNQRSRS